MSIQVAILKVLASHGSGRATLTSLKHDIAVLAASGPDWHARVKRLAARVPAIDIFGRGYVIRDHEGWEITATGRNFLRALEAVTQDNRAPETVFESSDAAATAKRGQAKLIVVGHRFRNRTRRDGDQALPKPIRRRPV